jgi:hypothetical protein
MCTLRIGGKDFDIELAQSISPIPPSSIFPKGEPRWKSKPNSKLRDWAGLCLCASDSEWGDLPAQVQDVIRFIEKYESQLLEMSALPGVDWFQLDFPSELRINDEIVGQSDSFPIELIRLAAAVGLSIILTTYE